MRHLALMAALFLSACADQIAPIERPIPDELLRPEIVSCAPGETERALGTCALALRRGLDSANHKITSIAEIVQNDG